MEGDHHRGRQGREAAELRSTQAALFVVHQRGDAVFRAACFDDHGRPIGSAESSLHSQQVTRLSRSRGPHSGSLPFNYISIQTFDLVDYDSDAERLLRQQPGVVPKRFPISLVVQQPRRCIHNRVHISGRDDDASFVCPDHRCLSYGARRHNRLRCAIASSNASGYGSSSDGSATNSADSNASCFSSP